MKKSLKDQECHAIIVCDTQALRQIMAKKLLPGIRTDLHPELSIAISRTKFEDIGFIEYIQSLPGFNGWQFLTEEKTITVYEQIVLASLNNENYFNYVQKQPYFSQAMELIVSRGVLHNYFAVTPVVDILNDNGWLKFDKNLFLVDEFRTSLSVYLMYALKHDRLDLNNQQTIELYQKCWKKVPFSVLETLYEKKPFLSDLTLPEAMNINITKHSQLYHDYHAYNELSNVMPNRFQLILNNHQSTMEDLIELTSGWYQPLSENQHENYISLFNHLKKTHQEYLPDYFQKIEQDLIKRDKVEEKAEMDEFARIFGKIQLYYKMENQNNTVNLDDTSSSPKMKI